MNWWSGLKRYRDDNGRFINKYEWLDIQRKKLEVIDRFLVNEQIKEMLKEVKND